MKVYSHIRRSWRAGNRIRLTAWAMLLAAGIFLLAIAPHQTAFSDDGVEEQVVWLRVEGEIETGLEAYLRRVLAEAEDDGAARVVLELTTPGGRVDAAMGIRDAILESEVPVAVWVRARALSAGALISIAADDLYMTPGSSIGAAEPRPANEKVISAWTAELRDTAQLRGRDPQIAAAMSDQSVVIPDLVDAGELLTLTQQQALEHDFIEGVAATRGELLDSLGLSDARVREVQPTGAERLARFITSPVVAPLLLSVGMIGLLAEFFLPGFGVPGAIGLISLSLYFGGHLIAGFGGWEAVMLLLFGLAAMVAEVFMPGFGVFGLVGLALFIASIFVVSPSPAQAINSLAISLLLSIVAVVIFWRFIGFEKGVLRKVLLLEKQEILQGYVAPKVQDELIGRIGVVQTFLHPAGTVVLSDGHRVDAVSEGDFVPAGKRVKVIAVEGVRVIVRPLPSEEGTETDDH